MRYTLVMNDREYPVNSMQQLTGYLNGLQGRAFSSVTLFQKTDEPPKWYERFVYHSVGLVSPTEQSQLAVLTNKERGLAFLTFVDDKEHTYYSSNPDLMKTGNGKVMFLLDNGEREECEPKECVKIEIAINALISFFETGRKPSLLNWARLSPA